MSDEDREQDWKDHAIAALDPKHGLWRLVPAPLIAALHFTVTYIGTSVHCIRTDAGALGDVRVVLGALTLVAVLAIALLSWGAWRRLRLVRKSREGRPKRRQEVEFLARITLYLANLSWVGVLFVAAPLVFFGRC